MFVGHHNLTRRTGLNLLKVRIQMTGWLECVMEGHTHNLTLRTSHDDSSQFVCSYWHHKQYPWLATKT